MRYFRQTKKFAAALALMSLLSACASYSPQPIDLADNPGEIHTRTDHDITLSTTILSDAQAQQLYGVDLSAHNLQAIWLRIDNRSDHAHWLLVSALDSSYYPPDEAAALFRGNFSAETEEKVTERFRELAIPLKTPAQSVTQGYVLAPMHEGGRYVVVSLAGNRHVVDFGIAVTLPSGEFDFERLDPQKIYGTHERPNLDVAQLRAELGGLPCCVTNKAGDRYGDPLNLVVIGDVDDVLAAMARADWSFTHRIQVGTVRRMISAAIAGEDYPVAPVSSLYFQGRPQDLALQRARSNIAQRNHLRLWLAPFKYDNRSVWVGQISRDIAVKATNKSPTLTTHVIDPNVDEAREHLLQSLMVAGVIKRFAFVRGMDPANADTPLENLTGDPFFTDGMRFFVELADDEVIHPENIEFIEWQNSDDPIMQSREVQSD